MIKYEVEIHSDNRNGVHRRATVEASNVHTAVTRAIIDSDRVVTGAPIKLAKGERLTISIKRT